MQTKLTLRLQKDIIEEIKVYALKHGRSLSDLTEVLYRNALNDEKQSDIDLSPIAKKYHGIIKQKDVDVEEERLKFLLGKH